MSILPRILHSCVKENNISNVIQIFRYADDINTNANKINVAEQYVYKCPSFVRFWRKYFIQILKNFRICRLMYLFFFFTV